MTMFNFFVEDIGEAKKAIKLMDDKFNANQQVKKALYREIKQVHGNEFVCDFVLPFPDLRAYAWFSVAITVAILFFFPFWWLIPLEIIIFSSAYATGYMLSTPFLFKALQKGLKKNGYNGKVWRTLS